MSDRVLEVLTECSSLPLPASGIEERLPLSREIAIASWNTEEESIIPFHDLWGNEGNRIGLPRCIHLLKHLFGQSLFDSANTLMRFIPQDVWKPVLHRWW